MNQSQGNQKQEQPQAPGEITINVEAQKFSWSLSVDPMTSFEIIQQMVNYDLFNQRIEENCLKYILDGHLINKIEKKTLQELGFYNNCILNINVCPVRNCQKFTFRIITKQSTFNFDLQYHTSMLTSEFDQEVKKRIFELSGLQGSYNIQKLAERDYIGRLIYQSRSTFIPSDNKENDFLNSMLANTQFDVVLALIGNEKVIV